ncbi:hypothetical protein JHK86_023499 [Glycine max]|nr:hypothetical protein JHK86_023499 [Glycine max]
MRHEEKLSLEMSRSTAKLKVWPNLLPFWWKLQPSPLRSNDAVSLVEILGGGEG